MSILIRNARMVNEGQIQQGDMLIRHGRIEKMAAEISAPSDIKQEIDAAGCYLLPGMIDDQVHFRDPGLTHKGSIATESRAAVAGGITSFMDMPNTKPPTLTQQALTDKLALGAQTATANYAFHFGVSNDNLDEVLKVDPRRTPGIKVFMGASTGNMLVDDPKVLEALFAQAPTIVLTHCEDTPMISANEAAFRERFGDAVPAVYHPIIRGREACLKSSSLAVELARKHGTRLHVLHITTADELALFDQGPMANKQITAEVCVHHLLFDERDYADLGYLIKCNPAIKTRQDRDALRAALASNVLDIIGTDHAPHTREEKACYYFQAPSGLPLVQHALAGALELVHDGVLSIEQLVQKTSHNVAQRFRIEERGFLREGYWADVVLVEMAEGETVSNDNCLYHCGWTPFAGRHLRSRVLTTLVSGQVAWHEGQIRPDCRGMALRFSL